MVFKTCQYYFHVNYRIRTKKGEIRWLSDHIRQLWDDKAGRVTELLGCVQDITSQKQAEAEIKPAPSDMRDAPLDKANFDAKVVSPHGPLTDLVTEKMSLVAAFGHVKIDGDLPKLMTQVEGFVAFLKFIGSLPVDWGT